MMFSARYWQPRRSIIYSSNQIAQNIRGPPTPKCKRSFLWEYYPYKLEFIFSYMSPQLQPPKSKKQSVRVLQTRIQNSFACTEIINSNGLLFFSIFIFSYTIQVPDSYREVSSSFSFLQNNSIRYFLSPTKAPYCYDAFVLPGSWSKGTLFNYLLYFFFLLTTVVPMAAPPLTNSKAIHKARLLVSPVCGDLESSFSFAVTVSAFLISFVPSLSL